MFRDARAAPSTHSAVAQVVGAEVPFDKFGGSVYHSASGVDGQRRGTEGGTVMARELTLRDYQEGGRTEVEGELAGGASSVMMTLATGGGKTEIAVGWARERRRTLFLAPSVAVVDQSVDRFNGYGLKAVGARGGDWPIGIPGFWPRRARVMVSSYTTAQNRLLKSKRWPKFDLLIIDEAHHAADNDNGRGKQQLTALVLEAQARGIPVIGITATCWRLEKTVGFANTWQRLVQRETWPQLAQMGYLAPAKLETIAEAKRIVGGQKVGGEFTASGIEEYNRDNPTFTEGAIDWWMGRAVRQDGTLMQSIISAVGQQHAVNLANYCNYRGVRVGMLISDDVWRRQAGDGVITDVAVAVRAFRNGELDALVNVAMVKEGFDAPAAECVLLTRPTESLALYLQQVGRASRLSEGKTHALVLDATDNSERLDHPMRHWEWTLDPRGEPGEGGLVGRDCEWGIEATEQVACGARIHPAHRRCPLCDALQGLDCDKCGRFTYWGRITSRAGLDVVCPRCSSAMDVDIQRREWDALQARNLRHRIATNAAGACAQCGHQKVRGKFGEYCYNCWRSRLQAQGLWRNQFEPVAPRPLDIAAAATEVDGRTPPQTR